MLNKNEENFKKMMQDGEEFAKSIPSRKRLLFFLFLMKYLFMAVFNDPKILETILNEVHPSLETKKDSYRKKRYRKRVFMFLNSSYGEIDRIMERANCILADEKVEQVKKGLLKLLRRFKLIIGILERIKTI